MGKKTGEANGKKEAGNVRKAEAAAMKAAAANASKEAAEADEWSKGSKSSARKEAEAAKKAEQARKQAEKRALQEEEERSLPSRTAPKNAKTAVKKTRGLDLSQLEDNKGSDEKPLAALNASGIDNALDALSLTAKASASDWKVDKHPERRFPAALAAYEERRLKEMTDDGSGQGLRLQQRKDKIRKDFEKSPENPFNQVTARYDASKDELAQIKEQEKGKVERRLGSS